MPAIFFFSGNINLEESNRTDWVMDYYQSEKTWPLLTHFRILHLLYQKVLVS